MDEEEGVVPTKRKGPFSYGTQSNMGYFRRRRNSSKSIRARNSRRNAGPKPKRYS